MGDFDIGFGSGGSGGDVRITRHARKRWRERVEKPPSWAIELDEDIWREAERVVVPTKDCDESRLYTMPGTRNMILCGKRRADGGLNVATAVYAYRETVMRP